MNSRQRIILGVGLVVVAAMCMVPPWERTWSAASTPLERVPAGYALIVSPPAVLEGYGVRMDLGRLSVQLMSVAALCGALLLDAGWRRKDGGT